MKRYPRLKQVARACRADFRRPWRDIPVGTMVKQVTHLGGPIMVGPERIESMWCITCSTDGGTTWDVVSVLEEPVL